MIKIILISVKVTMNSGVHYVYGGGLPSTYQTLQLHFHWGSTEHQGSEHTINGQAFPLEVWLFSQVN